MIIKSKDGCNLVSKKGKNFGGPYPTRIEAINRFREIEYFKNSSKESDLYVLDEDDELTEEYIEEDDDDELVDSESKELLIDHTPYCFLKGFEVKEIEGEFYVDGFISTSHIDEVNDKVPKTTMEIWAKELNEGVSSSNKASYHHDRKPKVVGVAVKGSAKVIQLPDKEYGLFVRTHVNKTAEEFKELRYEVENQFIDGFSIEYNTNQGATTHKEFINGLEIRILDPKTELKGYGFASRAIQKEATILNYSYKELKGDIMADKDEVKSVPVTEKKEEKIDIVTKEELDKKTTEMKEKFDKSVAQVTERLDKMEVKENTLKTEETKEVSMEVKEFKEILSGHVLDVKEQFIRASRLAEKRGLISPDGFALTKSSQAREYKSFATNGRKLEYKSLGITTNQNSDTDYLQSSAELQDVYDPVIYNMLNQSLTTWNVLNKDNLAGKGNNQVQFTAKIAANTTAAFYTGNGVTTGNVSRLKYQTKFKKLQVGISIDGDMITAARGGPVGDVFAQEVMDSTDDLLSVLNAALYAEVGLETAAGIIGFEYITDSAGNTSLYNMTRSAANKLAPDSAGDTYINMSSVIISMGNLRAAVRQARKEGAKKNNLVFFTNDVQVDLYKGKFDDARRMLSPKDTSFGFATDAFVDEIPIFADKDCNTDDWFLVDLETHRVAIWQPPTIEKLGKSGDSEDAFIKAYLATYNRAPRRMVQIYGCATS